ncbi:hypothetical protein E5676_scaffold2030G00560 [Cucumis melo var. makuwa]|uniref:Uncharacterized protein n=1 Tax=Cucumis melo var. makuwa TaxID=1194695 RepID=A0A5D3DZG1_CUCMM|nr:hypothetical protein E5676_scaffold2030G00560 [Cucumis melo var. makuwa]
MVVSFKTTLLTSSYPLKELFTKVPVLTLPNKMGLSNEIIVTVACSLMLSTSLPSYLSGDAILNRMPFRVLYFHTPLDCLKQSPRAWFANFPLSSSIRGTIRGTLITPCSPKSPR